MNPEVGINYFPWIDVAVIVLGMILTFFFVMWWEERKTRKHMERLLKETHESVLDGKPRLHP